jgi:3-dehydroquinate synthetase
LGLPTNDAARIQTLLKAANLPTQIKLTETQKQKILEAMKLDKKVSRGEIKFVLAQKIGQVQYGQKIPEQEVAAILN